MENKWELKKGIEVDGVDKRGSYVRSNSVVGSMNNLKKRPFLTCEEWARVDSEQR